MIFLSKLGRTAGTMTGPYILDDRPSIGSEFLRELRDKNVQGDRLRFRHNVERLGEIMAFEVSKNLVYQAVTVETPLGTKTVMMLREQPVLITILRAGLPFFQGFLNLFDKADSGFIGAYRQEGSKEIKIKVDYAATPPIVNRDLILIDPMLATGRSVIDAVDLITRKGAPRHLHLVSLIAASEGIRYVQRNLKLAHSIWTCAVDDKLNDQFYIVPGLGDAGDLSFGEKV